MSDKPAETESIVQDTVVVRRSPRYFNFMLLGAIVGVLAALVLTFAIPQTAGAPLDPEVSGAEYSSGQVFGFMLFFTVPGGVVLGAVAAIVFDRVASRRQTVVTVENVRTSSLEEHSEPGSTPDESAVRARDAGSAVQPPTTEGPAA